MDSGRRRERSARGPTPSTADPAVDLRPSKAIGRLARQLQLQHNSVARWISRSLSCRLNALTKLRVDSGSSAGRLARRAVAAPPSIAPASARPPLGARPPAQELAICFPKQTWLRQRRRRRPRLRAGPLAARGAAGDGDADSPIRRFADSPSAIGPARPCRPGSWPNGSWWRRRFQKQAPGLAGAKESR